MALLLDFSLTGILAVYGAVLSSLTAAVQLSNHFRDRAKVVLKIRKNMVLPGSGHGYEGMNVTIVTATNVGRRPVTIHAFGASLLFKNGRAETDWVLHDMRPTPPCEITEGKEVSAFVNQKEVDFSSISHWYAWDSAGRFYKLNIAPWHKRWVSAFRYKLAK